MALNNRPKQGHMRLFVQETGEKRFIWPRTSCGPDRDHVVVNQQPKPTNRAKLDYKGYKNSDSQSKVAK